MISYNPDSRKATKCHLCQGKPKCVAACPAQSLSFVPWLDLTGRTSPRNPLTAILPPDRVRNCAECHMPGYRQNIRETGFGGGPLSPRGRGFKWIDLTGTILVPLALVSVLGHALIRKVGKR